MEPFPGTGAMSIYTAFNGLCEKFILNDVNSQVISMLRQCIGENGDGKFGKDLQDSSHHLKVVVFRLW
ncbi:MAG: DNA adenine methylase [Lachnospiraceae bacterium]